MLRRPASGTGPTRTARKLRRKPGEAAFTGTIAIRTFSALVLDLERAVHRQRVDVAPKVVAACCERFDDIGHDLRTLDDLTGEQGRPSRLVEDVDVVDICVASRLSKQNGS
jgi:hypothetical protein